MLIDRLLPHSDYHEYHSTVVRGEPDRVYEVIRHGELVAHPIVRALLTLRGLSGAPKTFSLALFVRQGFAIVGEDPPREIVLGIEGPFWKPNCRLGRVDAESFRRPVAAGTARAAWNFAIERRGDGTALVSTETRVLCSDWRFRAYWVVVRPFSGLIRRLMLRAIRKEAEG